MTRIAKVTFGVTLSMLIAGCSDDDKTVNAPDPMPHVAMTLPASNAHISDLVPLEATAADDKGVSHVEFYFDGTLVGSDPAPPYRYVLNTSGLPHNSDHSIFAVAYDTDEHKTGSVPIFVTIDTNLAAPEPVALFDPTTITTTGMTLTWSKDTDLDFGTYRLRYDTASDGPIVGGEKVLTQQTDTTWAVTGLMDTAKYRFEVMVQDRSGHTSTSNVVEGTTHNAPPPAPTIISVLRKSDRISFRWTSPLVHDFGAYKVVRSTDSTYDDADQELTSITDPATVVYDYMTTDQTAYVYFVVTVDRGGLRATSAPAVESTVIFRYALQYDGTKYCTVPYFAALDVGETYTLEAWIDQTQASTFMRVIDKSPDGSPYLQYSLISDATLGADICGDGLPVRVHGSVGVPLNEWHHVALTYNHGVIIYYIDGTPVDTSITSVVSTCAFSTTLNIGRRKLFNEFYFRGKIDEVRVWNVVRTPAEIQAEFNHHLAGNETGLVCYYDFDEGQGNSIGSPVGGDGYLGETSGSDSADPVWVTSDAPIQY